MKCIILDSSAIFHIRNLEILKNLGDKIYITDKVLEELKDPRAQAIISLLTPEIVEVDIKKIDKYRMKYSKLSIADASIIACIEDLKNICREIVVITDDIYLKRIVEKMKVRALSIYFDKRRNL